MKNKPEEKKRREVVDKMLSAERLRRVLSNLSNIQIADLVRLHIWAMLPLYSPNSELIEEVIDRLEKGEEKDNE